MGDKFIEWLSHKKFQKNPAFDGLLENIKSQFLELQKGNRKRINKTIKREIKILPNSMVDSLCEVLEKEGLI